MQDIPRNSIREVNWEGYCADCKVSIDITRGFCKSCIANIQAKVLEYPGVTLVEVREPLHKTINKSKGE